MLLAFGAATYAAIRLAEAYGLFFEKAWAEILAAGSGAIYIPFELSRFTRQPTWLGATLFMVNVAVIAIMVRALILRRKVTAAAAA